MSHWYQLIMAAIGGGVFTSLFTFLPVMFGSWTDRKNYEKFLLTEIKKLKDEADAAHKIESDKRKQAEEKLGVMNGQLKIMSQKISDLQMELETMKIQLAEKQSLEEQYEELIVSYDNLESEHEDLMKKYIALEIDHEKTKEEVLELVRCQRPVKYVENAGMDPSGVPIK